MNDKQLSELRHELMLPLTAIQVYSDLLVNTSISDTQKQYLNAILHASHFMQNIINNDAKDRLFNLDELIKEVYDLIFPQISKKAVTFELDHPKQVMPNTFLGKPDYIKQILLNLLNNAVKFTAVGAIKLIVKSVNQTEHTVDLEFIVKDTGSGLSPQAQALITRLFSDDDSVSFSAISHSGLGLIVVKQLLKQLNADIHFHSIPKQGTSFVINLSLPLSAQLDHQMTRHYAPRSILVIEDCLLTQAVLKQYFNLSNHFAHYTDHFSKAAELLKQRHFDLIIMDLNGADDNAIDFLTTFSTDRPKLVISASISPQQQTQLEALGASQQLLKPFNPIQLENKIQQCPLLINWQPCLEKFGGLSKQTKQLITLFINDLKEIKTLLLSSTTQAVEDKQLIHKVHGSSGFIGLAYLQSICLLADNKANKAEIVARAIEATIDSSQIIMS